MHGGEGLDRDQVQTREAGQRELTVTSTSAATLNEQRSLFSYCAVVPTQTLPCVPLGTTLHDGPEPPVVVDSRVISGRGVGVGAAEVGAVVGLVGRSVGDSVCRVFCPDTPLDNPVHVQRRASAALCNRPLGTAVARTLRSPAAPRTFRLPRIFRLLPPGCADVFRCTCWVDTVQIEGGQRQ